MKTKYAQKQEKLLKNIICDDKYCLPYSSKDNNDAEETYIHFYKDTSALFRVAFVEGKDLVKIKTLSSEFERLVFL